MSDRYDFIKQLPSGGFGNVAVWFDKQLQQEVVVKSLINPTLENRERFVREAKILNKLLPHEHVVDIIDSNFNTLNPYIILEHCKHGTLQDWATKRPLLGHADIHVAYAIQHAALGLQAIHELGGVHRDIKPANLFVGENKQGEVRIKVGDFGVGRLPYPHTRGNVTHTVFGTEGYIAPEGYKPGAVFTKAYDIYSLGITGIQLVTGSIEPTSINNAWLLNGELKNLLLRMTSQNPEARPTASEVVKAIPRIEKKQAENTKTALVGTAAVVVLGILFGGGD